jgi:putative ABC transport system permease protein
MLLTFTLRHLFRHWRMNLVVLVGMLFGAALLAGLPMAAAIIAGQSLSQSLDDAHVPARNLEVHGEQLTETNKAAIHAILGDLVQNRIEIHDATIEAQRMVFQTNGKGQKVDEFLSLRLLAFSQLIENVELQAGRLPGMTYATDPYALPVLEAAIGAEAADYMDLGLGDEVVSKDERYRVRIVGIVAPLDPHGEIWWGDRKLIPFSVWRRRSATDVDTLFLSMLLPPEAMADYVPSCDVYWRVLLDREAITVDTATAVRDQLVKLGARLGADFVKLETSLVELIDAYQSRLALARISLLLLTVQSLLGVLYTLGMISAFLLDRSQVELASLAGRGYSDWQITRIFALEGLLLAFGIALPLGPLLAYLVFRLWSQATGNLILRAIPGESWVLALIAVAFGWLALVVPLHLATRRDLLDWQRQQARPPRRSGWQRLSLDFFSLALGGLAYWQLLETGSFVRGVKGAFASADPVLLLGPSLLLLAIGLVFLRLFPLALQLAAWMTRTMRSFVLPTGMSRLARDPRDPNRVVLLISLTAGLVFFATVFRYSIVHRQQDMAHYLTGADLRVTQPWGAAEAKADKAHINNLPGVLETSSVYRVQSRWGDASWEVTNVSLLAVNPGSLAQIAYYPPDISHLSIDTVLSVLGSTPPGVLPLILSDDAPPRGVKVGDRVQYRIGRREYEFQVRGIIVHFPTLIRPFAVTLLPTLEQQVDLDARELSWIGGRELWLDVDPSQHAALVSALESQVLEGTKTASLQAGRIAGDAQARLHSLQADLVAQTATSAFNLNALTLAILSSASFLLIQIFAARRRQVEFGVLRAMGLSTRQLLALLAIEGLIMLLLGLLAGTGIGYGLATVMRPFLSLTLAASLEGFAIDRVIIHWPTVARLYATLGGFYLLALLLLLIGLMRSNVHRTLRMGEE